MIKFFIRRAIRSILTLWVVVSLVFLALRLSGDPLSVLLPDNTPEYIREHYREKWGLDAPVSVQYLRYFANIGQGNLGQSYYSGRDASDLVADRLSATLLLGVSAFAIAVTLGGALGTIAALRRNTWIDRLVMIIAVTGYSLPNYFLGILLIVVFSVNLRWLPTAGDETWRHLILPLITLGTATSARIARFTRGAMLEVLRQPYMRTAESKGLPQSYIITRHAVRNAAIPVVTVIGFQLGYVVGGAAVIETVFAWPGIGLLFVESVSRRDLPVVQAIVLLITASVTLCNLAVDVAYGMLDPRISTTYAQKR